ncbi:MAG TPA: metallophosphoesterase [Tepidisphaeraceae bacterium]|nr:metallophosphoesterase [Tepidisphaeraceae bacterium]
MPITLPPISRRRFLSASLAATAGLALGCSSHSHPTSTISSSSNPNRFILLSDIHIAADPAVTAHNINMTSHLQQVVSESLSIDPTGSSRPSQVIVNGDCAFDTGNPEDYTQVLSLLRPYRQAGLPVHLSLGNHDNRQHLAAAVAPEQHPLPDRRVMLLPTPRADFILLDSLDKTKSTPGLLGPEQLAWLQSTLDARQSKPVIVMLHHQPQIHEPKHHFNGLIDTPALMDILLPRKQVKLLLFGHTHQWSYKQTQGLHLVNLPTTAYVFDPKQPAAWVDCQLQPASGQLQLHCLDKSHPHNNQILDLPWRA